VELMRRAASREEASLGIVLEMALVKLPLMAQQLVPFAVLFAGMFTFWRLTRNQELVVARGAGVSVWQFLLP
ncbi:MAG: LptF/LptG family permease, partial [Desulfuromonadales bacterium]|nr:LptF/LptG family permease [Desulfuromonadales bacterium]